MRIRGCRILGKFVGRARLTLLRDNQALLLSLGLSSPAARIGPPKPKLQAKKAVPLRKSLSVKRKLLDDATEDLARTPKRKLEADGGDTPTSTASTSSLRRSARRYLHKVDYTGDGSEQSHSASRRSSTLAGSGSGSSTKVDEDFLDDDDGDYRKISERQRNAKRMGVRTQDP